MKKKSQTGNGIAMGASLGFILGLQLGDDNIAWGTSIGLCLGLVIDTITGARAGHHEE